MSALAFVGVVLVFWLACTALVAAFFARAGRGQGSSPYPPEAAEAPTDEPLQVERNRELDEVGPLVVAGSDLDRPRQPMSLVNLTLRLMVDADPELSAMNAKAETLAGLYVISEVER